MSELFLFAREYLATGFEDERANELAEGYFEALLRSSSLLVPKKPKLSATRLNRLSEICADIALVLFAGSVGSLFFWLTSIWLAGKGE